MAEETSYVEILEADFRDALLLPEDAIAWLLDLWRLIQAFDDIRDGDAVEDLDRAIWASLVGLPSNPFYQRHQAWLIPAVAQAVLRWFAANKAEDAGEADEKSYVWRAGYYDVVCLVVALVHGPSTEMSWRALSMYGETFADYKKEFPDA